MGLNPRDATPPGVPAGGAVFDPPASGTGQSACDRGCLRTMLDRYLEAVVDNNPDGAPLAFGVRQTENAINFRPGSGPWESITGLGEVQRRHLDPVSGQAAYYGTVLEGDETRRSGASGTRAAG